ncbi:MAG TPA: hypothetical protein VKR32_19040 [Puia sp.]|nr:hypothetical protein [Puia sp.]
MNQNLPFQLKSLLLLACTVLAVSFSSCFLHYYNTNTVYTIDSATARRLEDDEEYIVVHTDSGYFHLARARMVDKNLEGEFDTLIGEHSRYLNPLRANHNRFKVRDDIDVLNEAHLYVKGSFSEKMGSHVSIPAAMISSADIYALDRKYTRTSRVLSIIGIAFGTMFVVTIYGIYLLISSLNMS